MIYFTEIESFNSLNTLFFKRLNDHVYQYLYSLNKSENNLVYKKIIAPIWYALSENTTTNMSDYIHELSTLTLIETHEGKFEFIFNYVPIPINYYSSFSTKPVESTSTTLKVTESIIHEALINKLELAFDPNTGMRINSNRLSHFSENVDNFINEHLACYVDIRDTITESLISKRDKYKLLDDKFEEVIMLDSIIDNFDIIFKTANEYLDKDRMVYNTYNIQ